MSSSFLLVLVGKVGFLNNKSTAQVFSSSSGMNPLPENGVEAAWAILAKSSMLGTNMVFGFSSS